MTTYRLRIVLEEVGGSGEPVTDITTMPFTDAAEATAAYRRAVMQASISASVASAVTVDFTKLLEGKRRGPVE